MLETTADIPIDRLAVSAPTEASMGDAHRVHYLHVPVAWVGLAEQRRSDGVISGTVVNGTRLDQPVAGAEVVLRVGVDGRFVSVESVRSGPDGRFEFTRLPVGTGHVYLPGANWQNVHFPGERIILDADRSRATTEVTVSDSKDRPSPLMIDSTGVVGDASVEFVVNDELSAGHPLKLEFGHVSVPWMSYAKWGAAIPLAIAVAVAVIGARRQWHPRLSFSQNRRARADLITTLRPPSR